jgi:hypothetical protein
MVEITTIQVSRETREKLDSLKPYPRATVEDTIIMLINEHTIHANSAIVSHKSPKEEPEAAPTSSDLIASGSESCDEEEG